MTNQNGPNNTPEPDDIAELGARLDALRKSREIKTPERDTGSDLGQAWQMSTTFVVSVLVGMGLGYGFDKLVGTFPWGLLVGLGFGFAAGLKVLLRSSEQMDARNIGVPLGDDMPDDEDENE